MSGDDDVKVKPDSENKDFSKKRNRKKRKNFLSNAKKYAKKGQMGRGSKISEELYQYFVGILETIKQGIEDEEERQALVNNVLERTKGEELDVASNQLGSRVIELLLPYSSEEDLERFVDALSPELRRLCSDNFTSHIIETLLRVSCHRATEHLQNEDISEEEPKKKKLKLEENESKYSEKHIQACHDFTLKISKYALNNLEDFVWDTYANHILRSALKCLSGITLLPGEKPKLNIFEKNAQIKSVPPHLTKMEYKVVPYEFKEIVKEFVARLSAWPQFKDLPYQSLTSGLLQALLFAVKNVDKNLTKDLLKQLLDESFAPDGWTASNDEKVKKEDKKDLLNDNETSDNDFPPVLQDESAVRLLEVALVVAKKKMYTQIYAKCFINRLGKLVTMPKLNFTVQRLLDNCVVKEEFEPMFEEVIGKLGSLLGCGNTGVIVALAKACLRLNAKQTQFVTSLQSALECSDNDPDKAKYFSVLCLKMQPFSKLDLNSLDSPYFINIHGSVTLQTILDFQRPTKAVNSLLELTGEQWMVILCDPKGCHVADALCQGQFVGVKARDKLIWKLKHFYQKLALSQYGSRAFEQIFAAASIEQKVKIMTELSEKSNLLNGTQYGKLIATKLDVATFKTSQKKWEKRWNKKD